GRVVLLADRSASMSVDDVQEGAGGAGLTRHQAVRRLLVGGGADLLRALSRRNQLELLSFADGVDQVMELPRGAAREGPPNLSDWQPTGPRTDLAGALKAAVERHPPDLLAGVIALTDGRDTEGGDLSSVAERAAELGVALHFVGFGSAVRRDNVAVEGLFASEQAVQGLPLSMRAFVSSVGYAGREAQLVLRATDAAAGRVSEVLRASLVLEGDGARRPVELTHVPQSAGTFRYEAELTPLRGEARTDDNAAGATVTVSEEKMSILLIAGTPSREFRFLSAVLWRDPAFSLALVLPEGGADLPRRPEELRAHDVLLLSDPSPAQLTAEWLGTVAEQVEAEGLGLAFLAGPMHTAEVLSDPVLARLRDLLPVVPDEPKVRALIGATDYFSAPRPVRLARAGSRHAITDPGAGIDAVRFWADSPALYWLLPTARAKPGATVLLRGGDPALQQDVVLAAVHSYGLGRVFYCGSSETWRWRRRGIGYYERFWLQALRHCAAGRLMGRQRRAGILLERFTYAPGEPVVVQARILDADLRPLERDEVRLSVAREGRSPQTLRLGRVRERPGFYQGAFHPQGFGHFELAYTAPDGLRVAARIEVRRPEAEFRDVRSAPETMRKLAERTGGRYLEPERAALLAQAIPERSRLSVQAGPLAPLWDTPYLLALLVAALTAEWVLRKLMSLV
ncbi:MAG: hypothetical protein ACYS8K_08790, partial [Planctomycetota bacterium]